MTSPLPPSVSRPVAFLRRWVLALLLGMMPVAAERVAAADATAATPRRGGVLRLGWTSDWRSLDPAVVFDADGLPLMRLLFRGLLDYGEGTDLVVDQASDWNVSPDGRTYTFHLRPGVKFAHGREVEAEDYVFAFERILSPDEPSTGRTYLKGIRGAEEYVGRKASHVSGLRAPDRRTFVVELSEPDFTFRYVMTMGFTVAVPRELVRQWGRDFQYHLVGSGPYRVLEWKRGRRWRFGRNPHYDGPDAHVDGVDIMIGGNAATRAMMLERGEVHRMLAGAPEAGRFLRDPARRSWLQRVDVVNTDYMFMNTEVKPFDDVRVRRAVSHAVDRGRMLKLAGGFGRVARGVVPVGLPWENPGLPDYPFDREKARALLREAGHPDGFEADFYYIRSNPTYERISEGIQQDLAEVGIRLRLQPLSYAAFENKAQTRRQAACGFWGWNQDYPDPSNFLDVLLGGHRITDQSCNNTAFYANPAVDDLLARAGREDEVVRRRELYRQAEVLVMRDAPWVPVIHEQLPMLNHPSLHGTDPHPVWGWRYERMWLDP